MSRVSYDKQQAIRDMVHVAEEAIVEKDKINFQKTVDGKYYVKLKTKADKLEKQAVELYKQAKMYLPPKTVSIYRRGDVPLTQDGLEKLEKLNALHMELATAMTFASSGKEYELIQAFLKTLKTL